MLTKGIFTHNVGMMPLTKVTDLSFIRTFNGRLLGYGTMVIESAGQIQALNQIHYLPDPEEVYEAISELVFGDKRQTRSYTAPGVRRWGAGPPALIPAPILGCRDRPPHPLHGLRRHRDPHRAARDGRRRGRHRAGADRPRHHRRVGRGRRREAVGHDAGARRGVLHREPDGRGGEVTAHLLGYLFDPEDPAIVAEQERVRTRARPAAGDGGADGRGRAADRRRGAARAAPRRARRPAPHGAGARRGRGRGLGLRGVRGVLRKGGPYYVEKYNTPIAEAVAMIRAAGGVAVFAHPFARKRGGRGASVLRDLAREGLDGVEVDHPDHAGRPRDPARGGRGDGPAGHRLERLPRDEQDDADRGRDDRAGGVRGPRGAATGVEVLAG